VSRIFAAIGRFAVRFRWPVLFIWIAVTIVAVRTLPSLGSVAQSNNTDLLPKNTPSVVAARLIQPIFGKAQAEVPIVLYAGGRRLPADATRLEVKAARAVRSVPHVVSVRVLGVAPDDRAGQVVVDSNISLTTNTEADHLISRLTHRLATVSAPRGLHFYLAGQIATEVASQKANNGTGTKIQLLSALFIIVLLLLVFRSLLAPFVTLMPAFLVSLLAGPVIAEAARAGVPVSSLTQFMLIVIVLGAGTDYGLFLVFRVREELRRGNTPAEAVVRAMTRVGESITFSAATVIGAFLTLMIARFGLYRSLGPPLAIAIGLMLLAGLTLEPALLAIFGRATFWPSQVRAESPRPGLWGRTAASVVRRPALTLVVGILVLGGIAFAEFGNRAAGFGGAVNAPKGTSAAIGNAALAANYPSSSNNPAEIVFRFRQPIWSDPGPAARAEELLAKSPLLRDLTGPFRSNGVPLTAAELTRLHAELGSPDHLSPTPPAGISLALYDAYRGEIQLVGPKGRTVVFAGAEAAGPQSSTAAMNAIPELRAEVARVAHQVGAAEAAVGGEAAGLHDVASLSNHDLVHILPVAVVVIGILLGLVLRSVVAPWYLVASVALSYAAALGISVLVFIEGLGASGLSFFLPFLMFLFLLALGEDYNILVVTRIREEAERQPLRQAVQTAMRVTGSTITSAGLVLAGTFAVFALAAGSAAGASQFRDIGFGLAIGVLLDTFVVRTLLVPSAVVLVGRFSWWPSRLHRTPPHVEGDDAPGDTPSSRPEVLSSTP